MHQHQKLRQHEALDQDEALEQREALDRQAASAGATRLASPASGLARREPQVGPSVGPKRIGRLVRVVRARGERVLVASEAGLATAEYAIVTVAAAGFAGVLIAILKSARVRELLTTIVTSALTVG